MERLKSFDGLKYLLIVLVILGHFIEPCRYSYEPSSIIYSFIFSFHMPLFILLSGFFYKHRNIKDEFYKCIPLIETCIWAQILFAFIRDRSINGLEFIRVGWTPAWYLFSLVIWRLSSSVLLNYIKANNLFIISIITAIIFFIIMPVGDFSEIMKTISFYPYFLAGTLLQGKLDLLKKYQFPIFVTSAIALVYVLTNVCRFQHIIFFQRSSFMSLATEFNMDTSGVCFYVANILCMISITLGIFTITCKSKLLYPFAKFGQGTLFIYFGQTILHIIVLQRNPNFVMAIILTTIATIILTTISRYKIADYLMHPIYTLTYKNHN